MVRTIQLLDEVALLQDVPTAKLVRGQVGTVVEELAAGVFEVEFCDNDGRTYAMAAISADCLIVLRYAPVAV